MNALRLARQAQRPIASSLSHARLASTLTVLNSSSSANALPLANVEVQWEKLSKDEQLDIHRQLEQLQKKDWKGLTVDEKKAAYYVAFGPHGPRAEINPPGTSLKVTGAVFGLIGVATLIFFGARSLAPPPPKTLTKEWQEAMNENARERNINPISGISSKDYKGTGFVQS